MTTATQTGVKPAAIAVSDPSLTKVAFHPGATPPSSKLPVHASDVTAEWLSKVLERKVKSVVFGDINPGTTTKVLCTVTYEDDSSANKLPTQLCIKGGFNSTLMEKNAFLVMIYQRECDFYNHVAPKLDNMELPRSYWAGHTADQGIIIMDDLAAQGHSFGDPAETWTVARVMAGVEQLAGLHSKTWNIQASDYPWLTSDYDEVILTYMKRYHDIVREPGRPDVQTYLKDQKLLTAALKKHYALRNPRFRCLLHGDAHTGNTYLVNGAPRLLDWQMIHIGSAFHDLSYFIASTLSIEDRRAHEWDIVEHYLRTLEKFGVERLSVSDKEVVTEYKKSMLAGVAWLFCPHSMQTKERVDAMAWRHAAAMDDHKVVELMDSLPDPL